ncbi:MAG: hypothetical protein KDD38_09310, partial [Bdellovibrionales bacterium]|nr:hypothetical protein [Bdellovibrionales bacterium]
MSESSGNESKSEAKSTPKAPVEKSKEAPSERSDEPGPTTNTGGERQGSGGYRSRGGGGGGRSFSRNKSSGGHRSQGGGGFRNHNQHQRVQRPQNEEDIGGSPVGLTPISAEDLA